MRKAMWGICVFLLPFALGGMITPALAICSAIFIVVFQIATTPIVAQSIFRSLKVRCRMGEIIIMGFIGGVAGFVIYSGGYWIDHKIKEAEKEEQAKRQDEDKIRFAPRPRIELKGCSACQGPYKPPQFKHTVIVQNLNHGSVPILDMKLEFKFKHVVAETKKHIWLSKERTSQTGELEIYGLEIYGINKDGMS